MKYFGCYTVFSIDNDKDLHTVAKFTRYLDTLRAMSKLHYPPKVCMGMYCYSIEQSYFVDRNDFEAFIRHSGYVDEQETFLMLCPRNPRLLALEGYLEYNKGKKIEHIGTWKEVHYPYEYDSFTVIDDKFFVCEKE